MIDPALAAVLLCAWTAASDPVTALVEQRYNQREWSGVVAVWHGHAAPSPALDYYAGMALAQLSRFDEARIALEAGWNKDRSDKRFPIELAGLAFKRKDFSSAKAYLRQALRLDPRDPYATDFLATVYFLEKNVEAALAYWNRTGKPRIEQVRMEPEPKVDPVLLDRAFAMSPASVLELRELRTTERSLDLLGIFARHQFALVPRAENEKFDLVFRATERNGWGDSKWAGLVSLLRGAPYGTIYPEWYNLGRSAINITSLVRFDPEKLRLSASVGIPAAGNPNLRWQFFLDGRKEDWDLTRSFHGPGVAPGGLHLEKIEGGAQIRSVFGDGWGWSSTVSLSDRRFARMPAAGTYFTNGLGVKYRGTIDRALLRVPERRLNVNASGFAEFGKLFASGFDPFSKAGVSLDTRWYPQSQGDRNELSTGVRTGKIFGTVPFDELYILGLERDSDLPLRAHIGTYHGRKGSAPLGRTYFLWNSEFDHTIYDAAFVKIKLGPFLDSGRITDPSGIFGSNRWLWDAGVQVKLQVLSTVTVAISCGKDLRNGRNVFYGMTRPVK